jgi:hypothetical protein
MIVACCDLLAYLVWWIECDPLPEPQLLHRIRFAIIGNPQILA